MKRHLFFYCIATILISSIYFSTSMHAQTGFVHASGKKILDIHGNELILRGIGTGNWLLQEGYMMETGGIAGTQWKFRERLIETIGEERTNEFYQAWWDNHFTKKDVDAMAAWGFNSVRVVLHYKVFTLPIEEEPIAGENTWLEEGFERIDNLLSWCEENQMYLILDMHGAPGAQGTDADISDYDPSKPSLWESEENKLKLIALWRKLAERYANSPWIGGYDLINEPNWTLPNNNKDLWDLYKRITVAIREVDKNHLLILGGNSWGNDYNGLPVLWDSNMALSFHKYWTYNDIGSINWMLELRENRGVPIWLGETGENSNTWFTELVALCEENNVGWSWWPVKKAGVSNVLRSKNNTKYNNLINSWRNGTKMNADEAFEGVMQFVEDHKFENCVIQYDVIDALITRPHTKETRPYKKHTVDDIVYAVDYDFGPIGEAYFDNDDVNYHLNTDQYVTWNQGWSYRNDGVDIETCNDQTTNGYAVGWIEDGEWMQYTIESEEEKAYAVQLRYASQTGKGRVYLEINGRRASQIIDIPATESWKTWSLVTIPNVIIPKGTFKIKIVFEKGDVNLNYFRFTASKEVANVNFELLTATTDRIQDKIILDFNKAVDEVTDNSFSVNINSKTVTLKSIQKSEDNPNRLFLIPEQILFPEDIITITTVDNSCKSGEQSLKDFTSFQVVNNVGNVHLIPARIEAEEYLEVNNFSFEECQDVGGGMNTSYTVAGSYLDFLVYSSYAGEHTIDLRLSVNQNSQIALYDVTQESKLLNTVELSYTGGWQSWTTLTSTIPLNKGKNVLRVYAMAEGFNLNWIELKEIPGASIKEENVTSDFLIYPNPATDYLYIQRISDLSDLKVELFDLYGRKMLTKEYAKTENIQLSLNDIQEGTYLLQLINSLGKTVSKVLIQR